MTKVFKIQDPTPATTDAVILLNYGTITTTEQEASIYYVFDHDYDLELTIDRQYFSRDDLLELRSFLDAAIEYQISKGV